MTSREDKETPTDGVILQLRADLLDHDHQATKDIQCCGLDALTCLQQSCFVETTLTVSCATATAVERLELLLHLADDHINAIDFQQVRRRWLQLHTDTSLLISALEARDLSAEVNQDRRKDWLKICRRLDTAIIVSGAIGRNRLPWIMSIMQVAQAHLDDIDTSTQPMLCGERALKFPPEKTDTVEEPESAQYSARSIPVLTSAPSLAQYSIHFCHEPVIIKGGITGNGPCPPWSAVTRWTSSRYLLNVVGRGRVVPVEIGSSYDQPEWTQAILPFRSLLGQIGYEIDPDVDEAQDVSPEIAGAPWYLAQYNLFRQFPELAADFHLPDYVWCGPDLNDDSDDMASSKPAGAPAVNIWMGPGHGVVMTPAHTDPQSNCFAQVVGRKRVWVAPPSATQFLSAHGMRSSGESSLANDYMSNTSSVPVLRDGIHRKDFETLFPGYIEHVYPKAMEALLESGDLLLLPPGWWHAMRSEGDGPVCSVSVWF